jgi:DNA repair exonuclease SbcCD ATPase subunit
MANYIDSVSSLASQNVEIAQNIQQIQNEYNGISQTVTKLEESYKTAQEYIKQTPTGKIKLNLQIENIRKIEFPLLDLKYALEKLNAKKQSLTKTITPEDYQKLLKSLEEKYVKEKNALEEKRNNLQKQLDTLDKEREQKRQKQKQEKAENDQFKKNIQREAKAVLSNLNHLKTLAVKQKTAALALVPIYLPILLSFLTTLALRYIKIVEDLDSQIDELNEYIDEINANPTPSTTQIAIQRKNTLINRIDSAEKTFKTYSTILNVLEIISTIASVALGIYTKLKEVSATSQLQLISKSPPNPITNFAAISLEITKFKAQDLQKRFENILSTLIPSLSVASIQFNDIVFELGTLRDKINNIEARLENPPQSDNIVVNPIIKSGLLDITYQGFKFAIREDNKANAPSVNGIYRHYGVAIDTNGIEVLRTDSSFTQDTQILVDQLKLIIDTQNLRA